MTGVFYCGNNKIYVNNFSKCARIPTRNKEMLKNEGEDELKKRKERKIDFFISGRIKVISFSIHICFGGCVFVI